MEMEFADFFGTPFSQKELKELAEKNNISIDPNIELSLCHATAAPPSARTAADIVDECARFADTVERAGGIVVRTHRDLYKQDRLKVVMGLSHPPIDATVADLQRLRSMGVLFCALADQKENEFGGGFACPDVPLTPCGKEFLHMLEEARMVLDLSGAGHQTARDALSHIYLHACDLCVVATNTGVYEVYRHPRNLPADVLRGIKFFNGLVGISSCTYTNDHADNTITPFLRHLEHAVRRIGSDQVCVGSGGVYKHLDALEEYKRFEISFMRAKIDPRKKLGARYPDQPLSLNGPDRMRRVHIELLEQYSEEQVQQMLYWNMMQFIAARTIK